MYIRTDVNHSALMIPHGYRNDFIDIDSIGNWRGNFSRRGWRKKKIHMKSAMHQVLCRSRHITMSSVILGQEEADNSHSYAAWMCHHSQRQDIRLMESLFMDACERNHDCSSISLWVFMRIHVCRDLVWARSKDLFGEKRIGWDILDWSNLHLMRTTRCHEYYVNAFSGRC